MSTLILASSSLRRLGLLRSLGIEPEVRVPDVDESPLPDETPAAMVRRLAELKRDAVGGNVVVAADTIVVIDNEMLGKPADLGEAAAMLEMLSGRTHTVLTGVAVRHNAARCGDVTATDITLSVLSNDRINLYLASGEPLGKAGAYAIQDRGELLVESMSGSYSNVIGLPLATTARLFDQVGLDLLGFAS